SLRFYVGIDSAANHDISLVDQLDAGYGMIWSWNSGYIFYMFEGKFIDDQKNTLPFAYHIGGDDYLMTYALPMQQQVELSTSKTSGEMTLSLEIDEIFHTPNTIDLNQVPLVS